MWVYVFLYYSFSASVWVCFSLLGYQSLPLDSSLHRFSMHFSQLPPPSRLFSRKITTTCYINRTYNTVYREEWFELFQIENTSGWAYLLQSHDHDYSKKANNTRVHARDGISPPNYIFIIIQGALKLTCHPLFTDMDSFSKLLYSFSK